MAIDFDRLLMTAAERGGSDLHLKPGAPPILRIHGRLLPQADFGVIAAEDMDVFARKMLPERSYNQLREGKEIDTGYAVRNVGRFRVNIFLALGSIRAVLRAIPSKKPKLDELGLPPVPEQLSKQRRRLRPSPGIPRSRQAATPPADG